jgi:putative transcriptional regulator
MLRLRKMRRDREMTQAQLGRRVGLDTATICRIENETRTPSLTVARDLASVFGVSIEELFDHVELPV